MNSNRAMEAESQSNPSEKRSENLHQPGFSLLGHHFSSYGSAVGQIQTSEGMEVHMAAPIDFSLLQTQFPSHHSRASAQIQGYQTQPFLPGPCQRVTSGDLKNNNDNNKQGGSYQCSDQPQQHRLQAYGLGFNENQNNNVAQSTGTASANYPYKIFNPQVLLNTLSILQQKIQQLQSLVHIMAQEEERQAQSSSHTLNHQKTVTTNIQLIISELVTAAGVLLPPPSQQRFLNRLSSSGLRPNTFSLNGRDENVDCSVRAKDLNSPEHVPAPSQVRNQLNTGAITKNSQSGDALFAANESGGGGSGIAVDNDGSGNSRDDEDDVEGESLPPGSYQLIEMDAREILAEHTHFCEICSKGFKRDANLRMHMRGHGDEYKTPAALARPDKPQESRPVKPRRYSCPFMGCKRNKEHKKFQPLKTMLCVKNHYRRSHCPKTYTCNRCKTKKFSVLADLKTHEKHCGRDKWQCSCGTNFSRKDKLFGHIALFQGHTPAFPLNETENPKSEKAGSARGPPSIGNTASGFTNVWRNASGIQAGSGLVGPIYDAANMCSIGPAGDGMALEGGTGVANAQMGIKNVGFSQEGDARSIGLETSNVMSVFPSAAPAIMPGNLMLRNLLSNNYCENGGS